MSVAISIAMPRSSTHATFGNYEKADVAVRVVRLEGQLALAAHVAGAEAPSYFILLEWKDGCVTNIRDYRYVPYITDDAELEVT
jgi:RNA polymerase sigma-70 factor (ECF subfamily)